MNEQAAMRVLLRKDVQIILPLVGVGLSGCVALNLLLFVLWQYWDMNIRGLYDGSVMCWGLMPGLVAFGSAAMLIGTEEDGGTLNWLRTIPAHWRQIAASKLTVALGAYATVWLVATLILWLFSHAWMSAAQAPSQITYQGLASIVFFEVLMLVLGFAVSYRIRMPLVGLITLIPVFLIVAVGFTILMENTGLLAQGTLSPGGLLAGVGLLLLVALLQHAMAWRRLTQPHSVRVTSAPDQLADSRYYRPPTFDRSVKPSQTSSLLWQQFRQTAPACSALVLLSIISMVLFLIERGAVNAGFLGILTILGGVAPLIIVLSANMLGVIAFYGDNRNKRYAFFADRGIAPGKVWWTRLLPPLIFCLVLAGSITALNAIAYNLAPQRSAGMWGDSLFLIALVIVMFSFGQLVSQWIEQPILAFLAAPAYTFVCLVPILYLNDRFGVPFPLAILAAPVPLFASWRLSKAWLEGNNKTSDALQVIGYTLIAITLPCLPHACNELLEMLLL